MGTKMAPTYATLVMGYLESILYKKYEEEHGITKATELKENFKRFLDDCFILWDETEEELTQFHNLLNSLHSKIQFTVENSKEKLPFLDVLLFKEGNSLHTDIFYKQTDAHQYLDFRSCHPKHTKQNIPYSLARRICAIVSKDEIRVKRLKELSVFLRQQNYPKSIIDEGIRKAKSLTSEEFRAPKQLPLNQRALPLVITHNPNNPQVVASIKQDIQFLNNSTRMKEILERTPLVISRRQPKNLKHQLTSAEFRSTKPIATINKCGEPRCGTCCHIVTGHSIKLKNGKVWEIKTPMDCRARNIIYLMLCNKCESFYIGQTLNLRKRVTLHNEQIRHKEYQHLLVR